MKRLETGIYLLLILAISLFLNTPANAGIEKPLNDHRDYRSITLDNGLHVLLISDPKAETEGAAVTVAVGSDHDPDNIPGLFHLLEHMVFAGSNRYPERGGFGHYITRQGGIYQGATAPDFTLIAFQVQPGSLEEALDRCADFLIAPTLDSEVLAQEIEIIQQEFEALKRLQSREELSAFRYAVNALHPEHPMTRFNVGNAETFNRIEKEILHKEIKKKFTLAYTANNMQLVVLGRKDPGVLQEWAEQYFSDIPAASSETLTPMTRDGFPDNLDQTKIDDPVEIRVSGHGNDACVILSFLIPPTYKSYDVMPWNYISNLMTSRQDGRLHHRLLEKGFISDFNVRSRFQTRDYATFDIVLSLTEKGVKHRDEAVIMTLAYLDTLRRDGIKQAFYQEQMRSAKEQFHNMETPPTIHYVGELSAILQQFPVEHALSGPMLMRKFDAASIQKALVRLRLENLILTVTEPGQRLDYKDPYSEATFQLERYGRKRLAALKRHAGKMKFEIVPAENPYIAEDHSLAKRSAKQSMPKLLTVSEDGFKAWFKQDSLFNTPRGAVYLILEQPLKILENQPHSIKMLYAASLNEYIGSLRQSGEEAGLEIEVHPSNQGIQFRFYGFTEKQPMFIEGAIRAFKQLKITSAHLNQSKAEFEQLFNMYQNLPVTQKLMMDLALDLHPMRDTPDTIVSRTITTKDIEAFHQAIWERPAVSSLIYGNYSESEASFLASEIKELIGGNFNESLDRPAAIEEMSEQLRYQRSVSSGGSGVLLYVRKPLDPANFGKLTLVDQMLNKHMFSAARHRQAIGYIVFSHLVEDYYHRGIMLGIQASDKSMDALEAFILAELNVFIEYLEALSDENFKVYREGARTHLRSNRESPKSRSVYWWESMRASGKPIDEAAYAEAELDKLTREDFVTFARELLIKNTVPKLWRLAGE